MASNYVKFQRGSQVSYDRLKSRNALEQDALYFIYDKDEPDAGGLLYLGDTLIGGTGMIGATNLAELDDVSFDNITMIDGMILQYNKNLNTWYPTSIKTAIQNSGAKLDGIGGIRVREGEQNEEQSLEEAIEVINAEPNEGDLVFINNEPYIYNGEVWKYLLGQTIEDRLTELESRIEAVETQILNNNHLSYEVVESLPDLNVVPVGDLSNKVFLVSNGTEDDDKYDEYMLVGSSYEKLGSWGVKLRDYVQVQELDNYVKKSELQTIIGDMPNIYALRTEVGDINDLCAAVGKDNTNVVDEVIELYNRLKWRPM